MEAEQEKKKKGNKIFPKTSYYENITISYKKFPLYLITILKRLVNKNNCPRAK